MDLASSLEAMLGYLNLSDGTPSAAFQKNVDDFYRHCQTTGREPPHHVLAAALRERLRELDGTSAAFAETGQAHAILDLVFAHLLPAYREHHRDLLFHQTDQELYQPFFLVRAFEAVLSQQQPRDDTVRVAAEALGQLNDFLGYRPVATLDTEQKIEPYSHERVRPIPLHLRGVGVACGVYEELVGGALAALQETDAAILSMASMDLELLDELALDPRAFDHSHPVNRRPAYNLGEWDPHHIDPQGRYRRFVLRAPILDALLDWVHRPDAPSDEQLLEAGITLAGSMLMASAISGWGPQAHDSGATMGTLVGRAACCRDDFYHAWLLRLGNDIGERKRAEAARDRQPFSRIRQHVNRYIADQRAAQMQRRHLTQLFARMGYPEAARQQTLVIPTVSVRMSTEIQNLLTAADLAAKRGATATAAELFPQIEDLLHRAIECGAVVDPWNILGFQGNFAISPALQDTVEDPRIDELLLTLQQIFHLYERVLRESAALGDEETHRNLEPRLRRLADWWDKYATIEVSGVRRVCGRELAQSALVVAKALSAWQRSGASAGDVAFWRHYADDLNTPRACAAVLEVLLQKRDHVAAMALLMHWLCHAEQVPLEDGPDSFYHKALRWMCDVLGSAANEAPVTPETPDTSSTLHLLARFLDSLEANADHYWHVPGLEIGSDIESGTDPDAAEEPEDDTYAAAYDDMLYRDSAADGQEGSTADGETGLDGDSLSFAAEHIADRLRFLAMLAQLWQLAGTAHWSKSSITDWQSRMQAWCQQATHNRQSLTKLIDALREYHIPQPMGSQASVMEYDRLASIQLDLLERSIATATATAHSVRGFFEVAACSLESAGLAEWERLAIGVRRALRQGRVAQVRTELPQLLKALKTVPILYLPLDRGGLPRVVLTARDVRGLLHRLAAELPRLGLFRETFHLLRTVLKIEAKQADDPNKVTEFNLLFAVGYKAVVDTLVDRLSVWPETKADDSQSAALVGELVGRFSRLWVRHVSRTRISELERHADPSQWQATVDFICHYGRDLFSQEFMSVANLRGILQQGIAAFLDHFLENQDPHAPCRLAHDLGTVISRQETIEQLGFIFRAVLENYDAYREYNTTTAASDYGDNLYKLLELLRVRVRYDQHHWALQPAQIAHDILARKGRPQAAAYLEQAIGDETAETANQLMQQLQEREQEVGMHLSCVADRIAERFVKPLKLDRVLALVEPAIHEAGKQQPCRSFQRFAAELAQFSEEVTGAGLEIPPWLARLENEVERVLTTCMIPSGADEHLAVVPLRLLSFEELITQLDEWDQPL